jgi:Rod binding domain-containing protein
MVPAGGRLREVAEQFESVFLATVISRMFDGLPTDGPFGGGHAEATYRSFLADEYAGALAGRGGIGIADVVYADLLRIQEAEAP